MQPTLAQVIDVARTYLGAPQSVFPDEYLLKWARRSYDEMVSVFKNHQLEEVQVISTAVTVTAGATEVDMVTEGFNDFGDPYLIEERPTGSSEDYSEMTPVKVLPQREPLEKLYEYTRRQGNIQFVAATQDTDIRFHYYGSGNAEGLDETDTIAVDDCLNFLGAVTAAKAGPGKGYTTEAKEARDAAYGVDNRNPLAIVGGYLQALVESRQRQQQRTPTQPPMYEAGAWR